MGSFLLYIFRMAVTGQFTPRRPRASFSVLYLLVFLLSILISVFSSSPANVVYPPLPRCFLEACRKSSPGPLFEAPEAMRLDAVELLFRPEGGTEKEK